MSSARSSPAPRSRPWRGPAAALAGLLALLAASPGEAAWRQRDFVLGGWYTGNPYEPLRLQWLHDAGLNLVVNGDRFDEIECRLVAQTLDSMRLARPGFDLKALLCYRPVGAGVEAFAFNLRPLRDPAAMARRLGPGGFNRPSVEGWVVWDEPCLEEEFAAITRMLRFLDSLPATRDQLGYINLYPPYVSGQQKFDRIYGRDKYAAYRRYLERFMGIYDRIGQRVPLLCADSYPFQYQPHRGDFFAMLGLLRDAARSRSDSTHRVPFWALVQLAPFLEAPGRHRKEPTLEQIRWQVSCSIAYGAKGVLYWTLAPGGPPELGSGMIDRAGRPTDRIDRLKPFHADLRALGPILMRLDPVGVWHSSTTGHEEIDHERLGATPPGPVRLLERGGNDGLVGLLRDARTGESYLYIVNKSLKSSRSFDVVLSARADRVERVRGEGRVTVLGSNLTRFSTGSLTPGTGAMFRLASGSTR